MKNCFLDMDGVFADFELGFKNLTGFDIHSKPKKEIWKIINTQLPHIFSTLPVIPMAKNFLLNLKTNGITPIFLTACPHSFFIQAAHDKRKWLREKLDTLDLMIPCTEGHNKAGYIENEGDILIDDKMKNIEYWNKHGGIGILHTIHDFETSFKKLMEIW